MNLLIIDGQGGGMGRCLVEKVKSELPGVYVTAVGTNAMATASMLKAGADAGATGENAVIVACRSADVIMGAMGIVLADAMLGEITAAMASAVGASSAKRILLPVSRCSTYVAGGQTLPMAQLIEDAIRILKEIKA